MSGPDVATVAGLFAHPSPASMVELLLDGRSHTVRTLARAAGIAASTATEHVGRLEAGGVVVSRRDGRRRLVRLAGPEVAGAYEALAELSREPAVNGLRAWTRREELRVARTCYDHLAGKLGVAIADAALGAGAIGSDFSLGSAAASWFGGLGVDVAALPRGRPTGSRLHGLDRAARASGGRDRCGRLLCHAPQRLGAEAAVVTGALRDADR